MTDAGDTPDITLLRKPRRFFDQNQNLFASRDAFRKQLERRHFNGLTTSGAVVETAMGLMIDPSRFISWLLRPVHRHRRLRCTSDRCAA
jgi:hypothetical protein